MTITEKIKHVARAMKDLCTKGDTVAELSDTEVMRYCQLEEELQQLQSEEAALKDRMRATMDIGREYQPNAAQPERGTAIHAGEARELRHHVRPARAIALEARRVVELHPARLT